MLDLDQVSKNPLTWPTGWPRTRTRARARFGDHSMVRAIKQAYAELDRMGVGDWNVIISSNVELRLDGLPRSGQRTPEDTGVAVYFRMDGEPHVLACDRWDRPEHNLWAIAKHIEALRAQDRWGVGTLKQAFTGYKALPEPGRAYTGTWWQTLGFDHEPTLEEAKAAYRRLSMACHPDRYPDDEAKLAEFKRVTEAWADAKKALG